MADSVKKKNDTSFENILIATFTLVIFLVIAACGLFFYNRTGSVSEKQSITYVYNNILTNIRLDSHQATVVIVASDSAELLDKNADRISKYEIKDNNLVRLDKNNQSLVLLEGVESASFTTKKTLPNLLTVRIFPADKKEIPFFTSFALRGLNNDMQ